MSGNIAATRGATGCPLDILLWCVQAFLALVVVSSFWVKLMGKPEMSPQAAAVMSADQDEHEQEDSRCNFTSRLTIERSSKQRSGHRANESARWCDTPLASK